MSSIDLPLSSDEAIRSAYRLMAMDDEAQVWSKFGRQEIDSLLSQIELHPHAKIVDVGCGSGRHALELALRGYRVAAFDFVPQWVERVTHLATANAPQIKAAGGELKAHCEDARRLPALEGQDLVLCLYDVVGSSPDVADAQRIIESLFRVCKPGGWVVVGCMNGMQMLRRLPADRIVQGTPAIESLPAVSAMQRCGEVFDFSRMAYDPASGVLYRREQFLDGDRMLLDTIIQERRYLPTELRQFLVAAGFESVSLQSVRAGQWRFSGAFDPDAPEVLAIARKPEAVPHSIPKLRYLIEQPQPTRPRHDELVKACRSGSRETS